MELNERIRIFESERIPKAVASLAIPVILSNLVSLFYNMVDIYFVGMISDPVQNAAVTLSGPVLLAFNVINNLFGVGCSSLMSRSLGKKDYDSVRRTSSFGFYASLFLSLAFSLLSVLFMPQLLSSIGTSEATRDATEAYLKWTVSFGACPAILNCVLSYFVRSEGSAMHASIGTMSGCVLNMFLDPFFVLPWGLGLGAEGAGLATFISNCFAVGYFLVLLYSKKKRNNTFISISIRDFGFRRDIVFGIFAVGIPASIQCLLNVTGMTLMNNFASSYGVDAVAAIGIVLKVHNVPIQIAMGMASGIMPLVSYCWASGNYDRMKCALVFTRRIMMTALVAMFLVFFLFPEFFIRVFIDIPSVIEIGAKFLRVYAFSLPLVALDFIAVNIFQAIGLGRGALVFAVLRKLILEIPFLLIMNRLIPLYGLAFPHVFAEFILAVAGVISVRRIMRKRNI